MPERNAGAAYSLIRWGRSLTVAVLVSTTSVSERPFINVPAQCLKHRIDELAADLRLVVRLLLVCFGVQVETGDEFKD